MLEKITINDVRNINKINVFKSIIKQKDLTRSQLSDLNNISVMTVKNIIDDLLAKKIITEEKLESSTVGRKPKILNISKNIGIFLVVELISKSRMNFTFFNIERKKIKNECYFIEKSLSYQENINQFIKKIKIELESVEFNHILGIGIVVPGVYDKVQDRVYSGLYKGINQIKLKNVFGENFKTDVIIIDHDVKLAALVEGMELGEKDSINNLLYIYQGEGVGGSLILDGEIYSGHNEIAGDIGQYLININGKSITVEDLAAIPEIIDAISKKINKSNLSFENILEMYFEGDNKVVEHINKIFSIMAEVIYNITWLINPEYVVISSTSTEYSKLAADKIETEICQLIDTIIPINLKIISSKYGDNAARLGAFEETINRWIEYI